MATLGLGFAPDVIDPVRLKEQALRRRFGLGVNLDGSYLDGLSDEPEQQPQSLPVVSSGPMEPEKKAQTSAAVLGTNETQKEPEESFYAPEERERYLRAFYGLEETSSHNLSNFGELAKFLSKTAAGVGNVRGEMAKTAVPEFVEGLTAANRRHIDKQRQADLDMDKAILGRKEFEALQGTKAADAKLKAEALRIRTLESARKEREQSSLTDPRSADSAMWRQLAGTMMGQEIDPSVTGSALKTMATPFAQVYAGMTQAQREEMRRTAEERNLATKLQAERESQATKLDAEREMLLKKLESSDAQSASKLRAEMEMLDRRLREQAGKAEADREFKSQESEKDRALKTELQGSQIGAKAAEGAATREAKAAEGAAEREFKGTEGAKERGLKRDIAQAQIGAKTGQDAELIRLREQEAAAKDKQAKAELAVKSAKNELDRKARLKIAADAQASAEKIAAMRQAREKAVGAKAGKGPAAVKPPKPGEQFKQIDQLRSEYQKLPVVKESQTIRSSWSRIQGAFKDPSAAGDLNLIFGYMKLLDPGSTVREGEFATAQNSGSAWNKVGALYNQVVSGERLTARQRADFRKSAGDLYKGQMSRLRETNSFYKKLAESRQLNPKDLGLIGEKRKIKLPSGFKGKRIAYKGVPFVWNETEKVYEEEE